MRVSLRIWIAFITLLGAALACAAPQPAATIPGMLPTGNEKLKDNFAKPNQLGWDKYQGEEGSIDFESGQYKINLKTPFAEIWANPDPKYTLPNDVIIEVQAKPSGSKDNYFGIICRYKDNKNFYFLVVSSDGYYGIGKIKNGKHSLVNRTEMPPSDLIQNLTTVKLRAECTGSRLSLFANDAFLDQQEDTDFKSGGVGLILGIYEKESTVLFDNFVVYELGK